MEYLESDFAQIEHVNQVLNNTLKDKDNRDSWDCFDTSLLLEQYHIPSSSSDPQTKNNLQFGVYNKNNPQNTRITFPTNNKTTRGEPINSYNQIRYNYMIVSIENHNEFIRYIFEIRNSLWDGAYQITSSLKDNNNEYYQLTEKTDYIVTVDKTNKNIITFDVYGQYKAQVRICFHMNLAGTSRKITETSLKLILDGEDHFRHQYDETITEKGKVSLENGRNTTNTTVTIVPCDQNGQILDFDEDNGSYNTGFDLIPSQKKEHITSEFEMPYGPVKKPGTYYCLMEATDTEETTESVQKLITIDKVQTTKVQIDWGDENQYKNVYRGSRHKYNIKFQLLNEFGQVVTNNEKLKNLTANVTFIPSHGDRVSYTAPIQINSDNTPYIEVTINYRKYYEDYSRLEVEIPNTLGMGRTMSQKLIKHPWFIAETFEDILGQLYLRKPLTNGTMGYVDESGNSVPSTHPVVNEMGTDWIFLRDHTYNVTETLHVTRDLTIAALKGTKRTILNGTPPGSGTEGQSKSIIVAHDWEPKTNLITVNLIGLTFTNGQGAVKSTGGVRLLVDRCYFTHNSNNPLHHKGCSIYIPDDDWATSHNEYYKTEIRNSYFYNNKGNEIQSVGTTRISNNLFKTDHYSYLQQPEVKVVSVRSGEVEYLFNKSYINTGKTVMATNHSYAKALAYVDKTARFNGVGPSQLRKDMSLPLYGKYGNQCYTYSVYYYPYENVRTYITCSPRYGYERKATGHASSAKNWVFYDGYYFVRNEYRNNWGNTRNPWKEEELRIPENMGIYDEVKDQFIENYDPRFSKAYSLTSIFDTKRI